MKDRKPVREPDNEPSEPWTRADLDQLARAGCSDPGCTRHTHDSMFLHSRCHGDAGTWCEYRGKEGVLRITCARCGRIMATVRVAEGVGGPQG